ncbi:hypothetical protein B0H14DRAFT_3648349 [Mycena olivaceomarginata]|nr:hypothetical protein B0H14DRAFT_3648349 [Mycena olivaceomarginata]
MILVDFFRSWAILSILNLCTSIFSATAFESTSDEKQDTLLICVIITGCINILAAYVRRNAEDTWFGWAFTVMLLLDSLLNLTTAVRIMKAYSRNEPELPQYMSEVKLEIVGGDLDVKLMEKS